MRLLILGGTLFLGRHLVESALAKGHQVTLFNRGRTNPDLFPDVEKLQGDRKTDLSALAGRSWDVAIDACGYLPRVVRASAELLSGAVEHYSFISSISVYSDFTRLDMDESGPVGRIEDPDVEEVTGATYGPLKALCEQAAEAAMPGRVLNVRSGLIVGPHDPTDRFTYWPVRVQHGGDMAAPVGPDYAVQFIDVRDLAAWCLAMAERRQVGTFNVTGRPTPLGEVLDAARLATGSDARVVWMDEEFLTAQGVAPWSDLPMWLTSDRQAMQRIHIDRALATGLGVRSVADTVQATLDWQATRDGDVPLRAGLAPEREGELLAAWRARGEA